MAGCVRPYLFPNGVNVGSPANSNPIPSAARDDSYNDTVIAKIQYTKNFGSTAFFRIYGYTFYSDFFLNGPYSSSFCNFTCPLSPDYELNTHTRGISAEFDDQIDERNLLSAQGRYLTATIVRDNNDFYDLATFGNGAVVVNGNDPYGGYCFTPAGGAVMNCNQNTIPLGPGFSVPPLTGAKCAIPGKSRDGTACTYMVAENGLNGTYSGTVPPFTPAR